MKVVLFCGGFGMRLREYSETVPKPLVPIGTRPILWHLMRYYAHYGYKDFVLCLGYQASAIKQFFLRYEEALSNDFILNGAGGSVELLSRDVHDWRITFVDTGLHANIGSRLYAVREHLAGEEVFLANYADGLSDLPLDTYVPSVLVQNVTATFVSIPPPHLFNVIETDENNNVRSIEYMNRSDLRMNGGFFVFRRDLFDYMRPGEELVEQPFQRLIQAKQLQAYPYEGFWASMDTFKDRQRLDDLYARGEAPWAVWEKGVLEKGVLEKNG